MITLLFILALLEHEMISFGGFQQYLYDLQFFCQFHSVFPKYMKVDYAVPNLGVELKRMSDWRRQFEESQAMSEPFKS